VSIKKFVGIKNRILIASLAFGFIAALTMKAGTSVSAQKGKNGTTLAAVKTLDICDQGGGLWKYSGEIAVWNEGALDTQGLTIVDAIQNKTSSGFVDVYYPTITPNPTEYVILKGTTLETATVFKYEIVAPSLTGDIRNIVRVKILNHSGQAGTPFGPEPKATWTGGTPQPCYIPPTGCTYSQGHWGNTPGVVWPAPYDRNAFFFNSSKTWQQVMDTPAKGSGYYILAYQYIAALLNQANGAAVPGGVQTILDQADQFFQQNSDPAIACPTSSSCGLQKTWAGILDDYNNGRYPEGPKHCE